MAQELSDNGEGCNSDIGTRMFRRADVMGAIWKQISRAETHIEETRGGQLSLAHIKAKAQKAALHDLRLLMIRLPSLVSSEYSSDDVIPVGLEWDERIQIAQHPAESDNYRQVACRLLADLRIPIEELREFEFTGV